MIHIATEQQLAECIRLDLDVVDGVEKGFQELEKGNATVPPIMMIPVPEKHGEVDVKSAFIKGLPGLAVKVASGFFENHKLGLPSSSGLMLVFNAETGFLQAILLDNGYLTQVRTGAAGAVAARYLAPKVCEHVGVIGAGLQARFQMRGLSLVRKIREIVQWSPDSDEIRSEYVRDMESELGVSVRKAESAEEVVKSCSAVVTTTPARSPVIKAEWLHKGLHITAMGADTEEKQELEAQILKTADVLACDLPSQCFRLGELRSGKEAGLIDDSYPVARLGALSLGIQSGRTNEDQITVCDLTGVGVQDTVIACKAYELIKAREIGTVIG